MHQLHRDAAEQHELAAERHRLASERNDAEEAEAAAAYSERAYDLALEIMDTEGNA
jgi:hypothetical protein